MWCLRACDVQCRSASPCLISGPNVPILPRSNAGCTGSPRSCLKSEGIICSSPPSNVTHGREPYVQGRGCICYLSSGGVFTSVLCRGEFTCCQYVTEQHAASDASLLPSRRRRGPFTLGASLWFPQSIDPRCFLSHGKHDSIVFTIFVELP